MTRNEYSLKQAATWLALGYCLLMLWTASATFASPIIPAPSLAADNGKYLMIGVALSCLVPPVLLFLMHRDRKLSATARKAGLTVSEQPSSFFAGCRRRGKLSRQRDERPQQVMIIGSTGRSFSHPGGELHHALINCREARIMLLDPREYGAIARSEDIADPDITPDVIRAEIRTSIGFVKDLNKAKQKVKLKLYPEMPLLKLAIIGDYASVRHYHTVVNVRHMPEFIFKKTGQHGGLYLAFSRYFLSRWQDPDIPEYDLESDELIYRDQLGYEVLREPYLGARGMSGEEETDEEGSGSLFVFR